MAKVERVQIHMRGVEEAFRSDGVVDDMRKRMKRICDEANDKLEELYPNNGYKQPHFVVQEYQTTHGNVGFNVHNFSPLAGHAQAKHSVLTQAMDAGRK